MQTHWFFPAEGGGSQKDLRPKISQVVHEQELEISARQQELNAIIRSKHVLTSPSRRIRHDLEDK